MANDENLGPPPRTQKDAFSAASSVKSFPVHRGFLFLLMGVIVWLVVGCGNHLTNEQLHGNWKIVERTFDGVPQEIRPGEEWIWKIGENKITGNGDAEISYRTHPTLNRIEITDLDGMGEGVWLGVYDVKGNTLRICISPKRLNDSPAILESTPGKKSLLLLLKRES